MLGKFFKKKTPTEVTPPSETQLPKWGNHVVLICEKCGYKIDPKQNPSHALRNDVKKKLIESLHWGKVRVMTSSCLDVCLEGKITVAFTGDQAKTHTITLDPKSASEALIDRIRKTVDQSS